MATLSKSKLFNSPKLDSRVKSANTKIGEIWLGYFTSPMLVYMAYYSIAGSYLTQFYTDVLGLAGGFLTMMPIISKMVDGELCPEGKRHVCRAVYPLYDAGYARSQFAVLSKEMIGRYIDKVEVYDEQHMEIRWVNT